MDAKAAKTVVTAIGDPKPVQGPFTLAIDIGGSNLKTAVLDASGTMITERARTATPHPSPPDAVLSELGKLVSVMPPFDRISVGFPGFVRDGRVFTAPNLGTDQWHRYPLAAALSQQFGKPARVLNDADVQGLGVVGNVGLEIVVTLGTGFGSACFHNGKLLPHLELGQHPVRKNMTYDQYVGAAALESIGVSKWNKRLARVIDTLRVLTNFEILHIGGGNTKHVKLKLPGDVKISQNIAGITGGIRLWDDQVLNIFQNVPEEAVKSTPLSRPSRRLKAEKVP